jgi:predicted nucleic acid-binding protein
VKTFVDTNVLVYAHDTDAGDRHAMAKDHLARLWDSREGVLSTQVLQEFYAVVTRKFKPPMSRAKARAIVAAYGNGAPSPPSRSSSCPLAGLKKNTPCPSGTH